MVVGLAVEYHLARLTAVEIVRVAEVLGGDDLGELVDGGAGVPSLEWLTAI